MKRLDPKPVPRDIRAMVAILYDMITRPGINIDQIADRRLEHVDYLKTQLSRLYDASLLRYVGHSAYVLIDAGLSTTRAREGKINPEGKPPRSIEPHQNLTMELKRIKKADYDLTLELERIVVATVKD